MVVPVDDPNQPLTASQAAPEMAPTDSLDRLTLRGLADVPGWVLAEVWAVWADGPAAPRNRSITAPVARWDAISARSRSMPFRKPWKSPRPVVSASAITWAKFSAHDTDACCIWLVVSFHWASNASI